MIKIHDENFFWWQRLRPVCQIKDNFAYFVNLFYENTANRYLCVSNTVATQWQSIDTSQSISDDDLCHELADKFQEQ
jgi:hypothetical protein